MECNSGSNRASNFKSAERVARGRFEITSLITPELYDTKSYYQLIVPITKCENLSLGIFMSLDQLVSSIFLFQLKLDSLPGRNFFIDFDWLSCAM